MYRILKLACSVVCVVAMLAILVSDAQAHGVRGRTVVRSRGVAVNVGRSFVSVNRGFNSVGYSRGFNSVGFAKGYAIAAPVQVIRQPVYVPPVQVIRQPIYQQPIVVQQPAYQAPIYQAPVCNDAAYASVLQAPVYAPAYSAGCASYF